MTGVTMGAHAEFVAVAAKRVARQARRRDATTMPPAVLFGGTTALHYLRDKATRRPGQTVLVNGASGAVGTNAVQLASHFGATVTGVSSGANAAAGQGPRCRQHHRLHADAAGRGDRALRRRARHRRQRVDPDRASACSAAAGCSCSPSPTWARRSAPVATSRPGPHRSAPTTHELLLGLVAEGALTVVVDAGLRPRRIVDGPPSASTPATRSATSSPIPDGASRSRRPPRRCTCRCGRSVLRLAEQDVIERRGNRRLGVAEDDSARAPARELGPFVFACARGDLNPHALSDTGT